MSATRWSAVERIFHAALDRPAAERLAFVAGACGDDDDLRREVHSLLEQSSRPGFLDEPAIHIAATLIETPDAAPLTGRRIGVYQLQELLGKGGMGRSIAPAIPVSAARSRSRSCRAASPPTPTGSRGFRIDGRPSGATSSTGSRRIALTSGATPAAGCSCSVARRQFVARIPGARSCEPRVVA